MRTYAMWLSSPLSSYANLWMGWLPCSLFMHANDSLSIDEIDMLFNQVSGPWCHKLKIAALV